MKRMNSIGPDLCGKLRCDRLRAAIAGLLLTGISFFSTSAQVTPPQPAPLPSPAAVEQPLPAQPSDPVPDPPPAVSTPSPQQPAASSGDATGKKEAGWHWTFKWQAWDGVHFSVTKRLKGENPFKDISYLDLSEVKFTGKFGGRLMIDAASLGDLPPSGGKDYELRKASFYMRGEWVLLAPFSYKIQVDDVAGNFTTEDSWIRWDHLPFIGGFKTGQYGVPFGLENSMTSYDLTMMEMSTSVTALAPGTNYGFQIGAPIAKDRMTWALGMFGPAGYQATGDASKGYVRVVARLTGLVIDQTDEPNPEYLHLGLSASTLDSSQVGVQYQSRPEAHLAPYLVDTGHMPDGRARQADLELAWVYGPFSLQSELLATRVYRPGLPSVDFGGYYVTATWSPTGESRPYSKSDGVLTGLVPQRPFSFKHGGPGAWEIALRFSHLDLTDKDVHGGRMRTGTLGASWYMNAHAKFMMNFIHGNVNGPVPYKTINIVEFRIAFNI
jgi:phosphate-selective porin OprO and OprP